MEVEGEYNVPREDVTWVGLIDQSRHKVGESLAYLLT